ncbi:hypothetical protein [Actinophytocola sediminis]
MHDIADLNTRLSRYLLRHVDADTGLTPPIPPEDEFALADRVTALACALRARAARCAQEAAPLRLLTHDTDR